MCVYIGYMTGAISEKKKCLQKLTSSLEERVGIVKHNYDGYFVFRTRHPNIRSVALRCLPSLSRE